MARSIIAYPIAQEQNLSLLTVGGMPESWVKHGSGLLRQVGLFGNRSFHLAQRAHVELVEADRPFFRGVDLETALHFRRRGAFSLVVCIFEDHGNGKTIDRLRRPGSAEIRAAIFSKLGVSVDYSATTIATTVTTVCDPILSLDATISVNPEIDNFVFDVTYSLLAASLTAERMIIEKSTQVALSFDPLALGARKHLGLIKNWLALPASDSQRLLREVVAFRNSLLLDQRRSQVQDALEHKVRAADFALAALIAVSGLSTSILTAFWNLSSKPQLEFWVALVGTTAVTLGVSIITYFLAKRS